MEGCRLAVNDLACRRGERVLFRGLSFELGEGEALQVVGPNGTGKSSLLRIVAGLLRPFAGTVEVKGSLGLVDERPALDEHLPLGKALAFWARIDGDSYNPPRDGEVAARSADGGGAQHNATFREGADPLHRLRRSPSPSRGGF
jgi:ABC-type multidrug transport system ATPase subunit